MSHPLDAEEQSLMVDPRLGEAIRLFNAQQWYACHDGFEELWHETQGPLRKVLQGILHHPFTTRGPPHLRIKLHRLVAGAEAHMIHLSLSGVSHCEDGGMTGVVTGIGWFVWW